VSPGAGHRDRSGSWLTPASNRLSRIRHDNCRFGPMSVPQVRLPGMAVEFQVTFDSADPAAHAGFWAEALHYVLQPPPSSFASWDAALDAWGVPEVQRNDRSALVDPAGVGPRLFFQKVPEPKAAKNRLHLDLRAAAGLNGEDRLTALEAECDRLVGLGANRVQRFEPDALSAGFIVMQDPEGNEFCLD
jgi:hypothetical protein